MVAKKSAGAEALAPAAAKLRQWLADNGRASHDWQVLAQRLADDPDMPSTWKTLGKYGDVVIPVFVIVCNSFKNAHLEIRRQTPQEEAEGFARVKRLAEELKQAIEQSPLPRNSGTWRQLTHDELKPVNVIVGWRDVPSDGGHYPISIVETLDLAMEMVDSHVAALPPRALLRHRDRPLVSAFVRWLNWSMTERFKVNMPTDVARITNAALSLDPPVDKNDVKAILKDQTEPFRKT